MIFNRGQLNSYEPPRVERIELSDKDKRKRWVAVIVLLAIGLTAFGIGISSALNKSAGWTEIEHELQKSRYRVENGRGVLWETNAFGDCWIIETDGPVTGESLAAFEEFLLNRWLY